MYVSLLRQNYFHVIVVAVVVIYASHVGIICATLYQKLSSHNYSEVGFASTYVIRNYTISNN